MEKLTKIELAKGVGALLGIEMPISNGGTVTREAWENVYQALLELFEERLE